MLNYERFSSFFFITSLDNKISYFKLDSNFEFFKEYEYQILLRVALLGKVLIRIFLFLFILITIIKTISAISAESILKVFIVKKDMRNSWS